MITLSQIRIGLIGTALALIYCATIASASPQLTGGDVFDAFGHRQHVGETVLRREVDLLISAAKNHRLDTVRRDRLWRLQLAMNAAGPDDYKVQESQLLTAVETAKAQLAMFKANEFPESAAGNRWLKARTATTDPVVRELFARVYVDQYWPTVEVPSSQEDAFHTLYGGEQDKIISANTTWLKGVLGKIGWFDISRYGEEASQAAWLLVQHADNDPAWQNKVLDVLRDSVKHGNMQPKYYAYLVDRVAHNGGRPQVYGTQGSCDKAGWEPFSTIEPATLDARRQSMGLPPEADYKALFKCH